MISTGFDGIRGKFLVDLLFVLPRLLLCLAPAVVGTRLGSVGGPSKQQSRLPVLRARVTRDQARLELFKVAESIQLG